MSSLNISKNMTVTILALLAVKLIACLVFMSIIYNLTSCNLKAFTSTYQQLQQNIEDFQMNYSKLQRCAHCENQSCDLSVTSDRPSCDICPVGWLAKDKRCYLVSKNKLSWNEAWDDCKAMDSDLLVINSVYEQVFLSTTLKCEAFWIGLYKMPKTSEFIWVDGSALYLMFWGIRQPDNYDGLENCVSLLLTNCEAPANRNWNDYRCNGKLKYLCERKAEIVLM